MPDPTPWQIAVDARSKRSLSHSSRTLDVPVPWPSPGFATLSTRWWSRRDWPAPLRWRSPARMSLAASRRRTALRLPGHGSAFPGGVHRSRRCTRRYCRGRLDRHACRCRARCRHPCAGLFAATGGHASRSPRGGRLVAGIAESLPTCCRRRQSGLTVSWTSCAFVCDPPQRDY